MREHDWRSECPGLHVGSGRLHRPASAVRTGAAVLRRRAGCRRTRRARLPGAGRAQSRGIRIRRLVRTADLVRTAPGGLRRNPPPPRRASTAGLRHPLVAHGPAVLSPTSRALASAAAAPLRHPGGERRDRRTRGGGLHAVRPRLPRRCRDHRRGQRQRQVRKPRPPALVHRFRLPQRRPPRRRPAGGAAPPRREARAAHSDVRTDRNRPPRLDPDAPDARSDHPGGAPENRPRRLRGPHCGGHPRRHPLFAATGRAALPRRRRAQHRRGNHERPTRPRPEDARGSESAHCAHRAGVRVEDGVLPQARLQAAHGPDDARVARSARRAERLSGGSCAGR